MATYISSSSVSSDIFSSIHAICSEIDSLRDREKKFSGCSKISDSYERKIGLIGGVESVGMHFCYYNDGFKGITLVGAYCCSFVGESYFSSRYSGEYSFTCGDASITYHYGIRKNISDLNDSDWQNIISSAYKRLEELSFKVGQIEKKEIARRKEYGQKINDELDALGFSKSSIQVYWKMNWRKEISPVEFSNYVIKARNDVKSFRAALACNSTKDLERFKWKVRPSVPRTQALLEAIAEVIGVKPMSFDELQDYKDMPGCWVFGE